MLSKEDGSASGKTLSANRQGICCDKVQSRCSNVKLGVRASRTIIYGDGMNLIKRRDLVGLVLGVSSILLEPFDAIGAGLPPEQKPRLCDDACEKELENDRNAKPPKNLERLSLFWNLPSSDLNSFCRCVESGLQYKDIKVGKGPSPPVGFQVAANYVAMIPSGQIFDSSLEKGQPYIFRVGSDQVIKGLDEGILSMKVGGKRRIYVPGSLAFPKGLISAPGRPRVAANSPVIFDVSLEYIPGLEADEE
ncbi:hypothetical protein JRO89_XS03G0027900 [Xanthoceras sorbifolium]|uniref:peptidylprolyl isomerase n=1 Tax=Xanthoceras sorbifolium TaxID=99658 RepID=A0ABQ8I8X1_9ROSI|nr:hypothetical protein JRO89_XS03G0027900 [Xanthoceras sorbifolium]